MRKNKNYKKLFSFIFMILFLLSFQTIVYSAFSSTMNITGIANSRVEADVRITDFRIASTNNATSSFEQFGKNHIITNVDIKSSSSSITYYLEITNYGSVDVGIFDITGLPSGVSYSIKDYNLKDKICDDVGKCNSFITKTYELNLTSTSAYSGSIQMNFDFRTYHKVSYTDIENKGYPTEVIDGGTLKITFKEDLQRVQVLSNNTKLGYYKTISNGQTITINNVFNDVEVKFKEQVAKLVKGNINDIGSEVCIGNECFYVISNDGSTVTMLSKYNLYVGGEYNSSWTAYGEEATGIQDSTMLGHVSGQTVRKGTTAFSSSAYWGSVREGTYVYDSNSTLYNYVESYRTYLESKGAEIEEARLIKYEELTALGCSKADWSCIGAPSWVYGTSYWSGTAYSSTSIWFVYSNGYSAHSTFSYNSYSGVRPVIELDIDEIDISPVRIVSGDYDTAGSEVAIGDEHFYIMSSDENSVTMLAKYNLEVGNVCTSSSSCTPIENPSGLQDATMIGTPSDISYPRYGTTQFSSSEYWSSTVSVYPAYVYANNSIIYNYIENYKAYLESQDVAIEEARLITLEELEEFGCSRSNFSCSKAPLWISTTSYWSGTTSSWSAFLWGVYSYRSFDDNHYSTNDQYGVRPVIKISFSEF